MGIFFKKISDLELQALADGELTAEEQTALLTRMEKSPEAQARYAEIIRQKEALKEWWKNIPPH